MFFSGVTATMLQRNSFWVSVSLALSIAGSITAQRAAPGGKRPDHSPSGYSSACSFPSPGVPWNNNGSLKSAQKSAYQRQIAFFLHLPSFEVVPAYAPERFIAAGTGRLLGGVNPTIRAAGKPQQLADHAQPVVLQATGATPDPLSGHTLKKPARQQRHNRRYPTLSFRNSVVSSIVEEVQLYLLQSNQPGTRLYLDSYDERKRIMLELLDKLLELRGNEQGSNTQTYEGLKLQAFADATHQLWFGSPLATAAHHAQEQLNQVQFYFAKMLVARTVPSLPFSHFSFLCQAARLFDCPLGSDISLSTAIVALEQNLEVGQLPKLRCFQSADQTQRSTSYLRRYQGQLKSIALAQYINNITGELEEHMSKLKASLDAFVA
ncbi:hypothetical protein U1Q18_052219 [Sarracenia purpurea var. burkii]